MKELARGAFELRDLADRFVALSDLALRACANGDDVGLAAALDARELVTARFASQAAQLNAIMLSLPGEQRPGAQAVLHPVHRAVQQAAAVNATLLKRTGELRMEIGRQLDALRRDQEATTAYHAGPPRRAGLNEVR